MAGVWTPLVLLSNFYLQSYPLQGRAMVLKTDGGMQWRDDFKTMNVFEVNWYTLTRIELNGRLGSGQ